MAKMQRIVRIKKDRKNEDQADKRICFWICFLLCPGLINRVYGSFLVSPELPAGPTVPPTLTVTLLPPVSKGK